MHRRTHTKVRAERMSDQVTPSHSTVLRNTGLRDGFFAAVGGITRYLEDRGHDAGDIRAVATQAVDDAISSLPDNDNKDHIVGGMEVVKSLIETHTS